MRSNTSKALRNAAELAAYVVLAVAVFRSGAWDRFDWGLLTVAACAIGGVSLIVMKHSDMRSLALPALLLGAMVLIHVVQMIPVPGWLPGWLAPGRAAVEERLGTSAIGGAFPRPASMDWSATVDSLLLLICYGSFAFCGAAVFRERDQFIRLGFVLAVVAFGSVAWGVARGTVIEGIPFRLAGTYSNPNRFFDLLALCFGASISAMMLMRGSRRSRVSGVDIFGFHLDEKYRWVLMAAACGLQLAAVATLSRAGIPALAAMGATGLAYLGSKEKAAKRLLVIFSVVVVAVMVNAWLLTEPAMQRFSALFDGSGPGAGRIRCWWSSLAIARDFPLLGSGGGSYRYVFAAYQPPDLAGWFRYPHSEPVGFLCDFGLIGLAVVLAGAGLFVRRTLRALLIPRHRGRRMALGVWIGMGTVAVHSLADYGLRVPATACVFAIIAGSSWRLMSSRGSGDKEPPRPAGWPAFVACFCVLLAVVGWQAGVSAMAGRGLAEDAPDGSSFYDAPVAAELERVERIVEIAPRMPDARYRLARAHRMKADRSPSTEEARTHLASAREHVIQSLRVRPVDVPALYLLAVTEAQLGNRVAAEHAAVAASGAATAYSGVQIDLARVLLFFADERSHKGERADADRLGEAAFGCLRLSCRSSMGRLNQGLKVALSAGIPEGKLEELAALWGKEGTFSLASLLIDADRHGHALDLLDRRTAAGDVPPGGKIGFLRGRALLETGRIDEGLASFKAHLVAVPPDDLKAALALQVRISMRLVERKRMLTYLQSLEAETGESVPLVAAIASAADRASARELAVRYYERSMKIDPAFTFELRLARLLMDRGDSALAADVLRRGVIRAPHDAAMRLAYARALIAAGRHGEARAELMLLKGGALSEEADKLLKEGRPK